LIVEDAQSFKENALIKARAVYEALGDDEAVVMADDSGISIEALGGAPGIYSARYAGEGASDKDNLYKVADDLKLREWTNPKLFIPQRSPSSVSIRSQPYTAGCMAPL